MSAPITFVWEGDAMVPLARFHKLCDKQFAVGAEYPLVVEEQRSHASHSHYFAALTEAWRNLREDVAENFPTVERLRKYALIKAGFADERSIVCSSKAEAQRVAAFIKPMDEYAIVVVREATIKVYTAQSQSMRAMGKKDFQASKDAVLDVVARMVGVTTEELRHNAPPLTPDSPAPSHQRERVTS